MPCFELFSPFSELKQFTSKCEVTEVGNLKGVKVVVCGIKWIDLTTKTVKFLGIDLLYGNNIPNNQNPWTSYSELNKLENYAEWQVNL